jgi:uncharacterized protein (TIGR02231 family)
MWKRAISLLAGCALVTILVVQALQVPANPPAAKDLPAAGTPSGKLAGTTQHNPVNGVKIATSRVVAVTVYPNSALITREVDVPAGARGSLELTVSPLPPATVNSSLYTEGTEGIRVLTTRFRTRPILQDTRADVRKLQDELEQLELSREKLEADVKASQANAMTIGKMEQFMSVSTIEATKKAALNSDSAIALSRHVMESRAEKAKELIGLQQQVKANLKKAEFLQRTLNSLTTVPARTERDAVIVVDKVNAAPGKVRLNYLVNAVSWQPQYKVRAGKANGDKVRLEYLAGVVQHTGEDWPGVKLVLSTAQPMLNAAPPELQTLQVTAVPRGNSPVVHSPNTMDLEEEVKSLRSKAQQDFNAKKQASGIGLFNTAAALDQSWELFNPDEAVKRGCALAVREGPTVTYHLNTPLTVPSRTEEQILEVTRLDLTPDYYYKAVPVLTAQVYRQANLINRSKYVLLPGEATMYIGSDFVGQMNLPLVAVGEQFTVGFGIDTQLQVHRQMTDKWRTTQGANQLLRYEYRILVNNYKSERVKLQIWDRLPHAEKETVGVSLIKATPEISKDGLYLREHRPTNLLRWDVTVDGEQSGEKALAIKYEFKLELDSRMTLSSFQSAGVFGAAPKAAPANPPPAARSLSAAEKASIKMAMAKLSAEDRRLAEAQVFCAIDQESPLGTMGPIYKVVIKGQPVFLCCKGCVAESRAHPEETLAQFKKLMARMAGGK